MDSIEEILTSFKTWKELFLERYWSEELRLETKMKLIDERYRSNTRESLRDFATRKITTFKACDPRMSESKIIKIVIRQLPYAIQNLLNSVVPINADTLQTLLARYDQTELYFSRGDTTRKDVNYLSRSRDFVPRGNRAKSGQCDSGRRGGGGSRKRRSQLATVLSGRHVMATSKS